MRSPAVAVVLAVVAIVAACGSSVPGASSAMPSAAIASAATVEIQVFAAASLKQALTRAGAAWSAAHPGQGIVLSTDSSAALATKIEQGAPADLFLSADTKNPQAMVDKGLAAGLPVAFATNRLVVIVPADNPAGLASPADLARPGVKVIAAGDAVPITRYAAQLVANLAALTGYPAGFADAYAANVVSREDSVAGIVAKVELGEGDAGIVYITDAAGSSKLATIDVPAVANVTAVYAGVPVKGAAHEGPAADMLAWLAGPDGQAVLADFGFLPAPAP